MEVTIHQILAAREERAEKQKQLLSQYQKPLLCFTMNISGPEKNNRDIRIGFFIGNRLLQNALPAGSLLHRSIQWEDTGCEGYYVVDMSPEALKKLAVSIEETDPIGRLFDMDVLDAQGKKWERTDLGLPRRKCLLCDNDAVICASTRAHGLEALQDRTGFLLYVTAQQYFFEYIAVQGYLSLIQELNTTPKPGLVDRKNCGSHQDMTPRHFFASANALRPYFHKFAQAGWQTRDDAPETTFQVIRPIGMEAEAAMLQATGGVNTHKGAIFSIGLFCAAAGRLSPEQWNCQGLCETVSAMCKGLCQTDFSGITSENAATVGQKLFASHGITGIRGQAEAGFPAVREVGLPVLQQGLSLGLSLNDAGTATLLHLLQHTQDTNFIHRSDLPTLQALQGHLAALLVETPYPSSAVLADMDREFIQRNLSPGGSADLLAVTYFLHFLQQA